MKKTLSLLLAVLMVLPALCLAETEPAYGMSGAEVAAAIGKADDEYKDTSSIGQIIIWNYYDQSISQYTGIGISYFFRNDVLIGRAAVLRDDDRSRLAYLRGALGTKYGEPSQDADTFAKMMDYMVYPLTDPAERLAGGSAFIWNTEEGLSIALFHEADNGYSFLFYLAPDGIVNPVPEYNMTGL